MPSDNEFLTLEEVSKLLRCSRAQVRMLVQKQGLPGIKLGTLWRFNAESVRQWLKSNEAHNDTKKRAG